MDIGKSVRVAMAKRDLKIKDLAEKMGVSRQYIGHLMAREVSGIGTVVKLCAVFDMRVSEFISLGED